MDNSEYIGNEVIHLFLLGDLNNPIYRRKLDDWNLCSICAFWRDWM